jgi:hypothetical protein
LKKLLPFIVMGILVLSGLAASALPSDTQKIEQNNQGTRVFTHTVFAEDGTATWCPHCPYAHGSLNRIFNIGQYPMYYTSLVEDKNTHALARVNELGITGYPTVVFDGGYKVDVGSYDNWPSQMAWYNTTITQCGSRTVPDIWTTLDVHWLGNATMNIQVSVQNNGTSSYAGHIRVFVTELESSMGWIDTQGHPYTCPFLDYAFNEDISVPGSSTWSDAVTWDGHNYNDGYGHTFGSIQFGNIMIIATVYNAVPVGAYYYADDCTGVWVGTNRPPKTPSSPNPANGATSIDVNKDVSWIGGDPDPTHDTVTYDVYFGTASTPPKVTSNQSTTSYDPGTLAYSTTYYWKIVAWDNHGTTTAGPVWHFTTANVPNSPPGAPSITGQTSGKVNTNYSYTFVATDPDGDTLQYYIDWGDGATSNWVGPYSSGTPFVLGHTWTTQGAFTITAKARDVHGAEGPTGTLPVSMPLSNSYVSTPFLQWLFVRFPQAFPMLRHLLGY